MAEKTNNDDTDSYIELAHFAENEKVKLLERTEGHETLTESEEEAFCNIEEVLDQCHALPSTENNQTDVNESESSSDPSAEISSGLSSDTSGVESKEEESDISAESPQPAAMDVSSDASK